MLLVKIGRAILHNGIRSASKADAERWRAYASGTNVEIGPDIIGNVGERTGVLLRGIDQLRDRCALICIHAREPRRDGKLQHAGLGAKHRSDEARIHVRMIGGQT